MAFKPNTLFAFVKSDNSFHGVDPIRDADVLRDLILYDIQVKATSTREDAAAGEAPPEAAAGVGLGVRMLKSILRRGR
jgi:hypothetical protein